MRGWVRASLPRNIMHSSHSHHIRPFITSHRIAVGLSHHPAEQSIFGYASLKSPTNGSGPSKTRMASAEPLGNLKTHACYRHPGEYPVRLLAVFHPGPPSWTLSQSKCKRPSLLEERAQLTGRGTEGTMWLAAFLHLVSWLQARGAGPPSRRKTRESEWATLSTRHPPLRFRPPYLSRHRSHMQGRASK